MGLPFSDSFQLDSLSLVASFRQAGGRKYCRTLCLLKKKLTIGCFGLAINQIAQTSGIIGISSATPGGNSEETDQDRMSRMSDVTS